jgi:uncharacterized protein (DUF305 family)/uncharacterized protein YcnI
MRPRHALTHRSGPIGAALALGTALVATASPAAARVAADGVPDNPGSTLVTFTVDEGCGGRDPTTGLRVRLPARATGVTPQAPPGWTAEVAGDDVIWTGGSAPPDRPATFVAAMRAPGIVGDVVYLPAVQYCGGRAETWTEPVPDARAPHAAPRITLAIAYLPDPGPTTAPVTVPPVPTDPPVTAAPAAGDDGPPSRVPLLAGGGRGHRGRRPAGREGTVTDRTDPTPAPDDDVPDGVVDAGEDAGDAGEDAGDAQEELRERAVRRMLPAFTPHGPLQVAVGIAALCFLAGAVGYLVGTRQSPVATSAVDQGFLFDMSDHHDQAVTMALCGSSRATDPLVQKMAREILIFQNRELARMASLMEQMRVGRPETTDEAPRTAMDWMGMPVPVDQMPGMASPAALDKLCTATGLDADKQFLTLMRAHHEGGVHMAEYAAANAANPSVTSLAGVMARNQRIEVNEYTAQLQRLGAG